MPASANEKVGEASWKEILDVNLMSYVFCAKAAVPLMRRNKAAPSLTSPPCVP
jgi:NAD(P)-dependent dehydrogenase (short-subunit alcohol dehydrogenase family)